MTNQLEEFIEKAQFFDREGFCIKVKDLREFFNDKIIIDKKEKVWPQAEIAYKKWRGLE